MATPAKPTKEQKDLMSAEAEAAGAQAAMDIVAADRENQAEAVPPPKRLKTLKARVDDADHESILGAITMRKSGLFKVDGELILPDGDSDEVGTILGCICREWADMLSMRTLADIRNK